jgi:hypothetical protein
MSAGKEQFKKSGNSILKIQAFTLPPTSLTTYHMTWCNTPEELNIHEHKTVRTPNLKV